MNKIKLAVTDAHGNEREIEIESFDVAVEPGYIIHVSEFAGQPAAAYTVVAQLDTSELLDTVLAPKHHNTHWLTGQPIVPIHTPLTRWEYEL